MRSQPRKATQQQTKSYNSRLVLKTIYDNGPISRADVARATHLTRTSVSDLVTELQEQGLVEEVGYGKTSTGASASMRPGRGRTPILLAVIPNALHVVAIDLANEEFRGAVTNLRNEILYSTVVHLDEPGTIANDKRDSLDLIYELVDNLVAWTNRPVLGIGIGTPGLVDSPNGIVVEAVNLEWRDLPLGRLLQERYHLPVYVANDSQVAALAVYMFEEGRGDENVVVIKIGHGIGAGIILGGHLFHGDGGGAGEIGHVAVVEHGERCRCGNHGCLETVASDRAVTLHAQALARSNTDSLLNRLAPNAEAVTFEMVVQAARACDPAALQIVRETGQYLGIAAANLVGILDVRHILILGSLTQFGEPLLDAIEQEMVKRALPVLAQQARIELVADNPNIVLLGASALLLTRALGLSLAR
jgi:N-acetylglucosamine repressor